MCNYQLSLIYQIFLIYRLLFTSQYDMVFFLPYRTSFLYKVKNMKKLLVLALMVTSVQLSASEVFKTLKDLGTIASIACMLNPIAKEEQVAAIKACKYAGICCALTSTAYCCGPKVCCCAATLAGCGYLATQNSQVITTQPGVKKTK